jgi:hypothetical protein
MEVPWKETLSEWAACAGLGLIPLVVAVVIAIMTDNERQREVILSVEFLCRELILFCIVTNAASVVVFVSKFNLLQIADPRGRKIPTALIFSLLLLAIVCGIVLVAIDVRPQSGALLPMLSCTITTLIFSLWAERQIGFLARE